MSNLPQGDTSQVTIAPARILVAPLGTALPPINAATLVWPPAWKEVGYTEKGTDITPTPTITDFNVDELMSPAKKMTTAEKCVISAVLAQPTLQNLRYALAALSDVDVADPDSTHPGTKRVTYGGGALQEVMIGLEGLSPEVDPDTGVNYWRMFVGYRAMASAAVKLAFGRTVMTTIPFQIELLADGTKDPGEQLFEMVDMVLPHTA
jgi:hypothetical protein